MKTLDLAEEIYIGVFSNKVRSGLTMLGVIIGIASVIAMLSVGQGAKATIESSIQSIGSNLLLVMPGAQRGPGQQVSAGRGSAQSLTIDDAAAIAAVEGVEAVAPEVSGRYQITARGTNTNTSVVGTRPTYLAVRNVAIESGAFFSDAQVANRSKVAVLGPTTATDLFGEGSEPTGQTIRIKGQQFTVIGVTKAKGGSGMSNQDDAIYVPVTTAQVFLSGSEYVGTISIQANDQGSMALVQESVTSLLLERHNKTAETIDFNIMNQSDIVSAASSMTDTFTILLASIASISLLVGGIGIMNMMLTTVTERTREIGLRQAIGAGQGDILYQFLGEAVLLTSCGGLIGILTGYGASRAISSLAGMSTVISWSAVALACGVSVFIGVVFGLYPAQRAARLNPIEALRYE
jgi:putative ABC transport system permease protein